MVPTWIGQSNYAVNGSGTFGTPLPTNAQADDLALLCLMGSQTGSNMGEPTVATAGWTRVISTQAVDANPSVIRMTTFSKILTASDLSFGQVQWVTSNSGVWVGVVVAYRGNSVKVAASAGQVTTNVSTNLYAIPSQQSTTTDQVLHVFGAYRNSGSVSSPPATYTNRGAGTDYGWVTAARTAPSTGAGQTMGGENIGRGDTGATSGAIAQGFIIAAGSPPNAPTGLTVTGTDLGGGVLDRTKTIRASWVVSDNDGNPQTGATVRYRPTGSAGVWTEASRADAIPYYDFPPGTFAGNADLAARTSDVDGAGSYSSAVAFVAMDPPGGAPSTVPTRLDPLGMLDLIQALRAQAGTPLRGAVATTSPLTVMLSTGGTVSAQRGASYTPAVGDAVQVELVGDGYVIQDKIV